MTRKQINLITARWSRLGAMFNTPPAHDAVDLERLLLDTARAVSVNSRLLVMAVTWLARHGATVAKHRLAALIRRELEAEYNPAMGLLLELALAADKANRTRFDLAIGMCVGRTGNGRPLSDIECGNAVLSRLAKQRASILSRKWGRWCEEFELKEGALRPVDWVMRHNPGLYERALVGGELVASIVAECESSDGAAESEAELARRCGASRPAIRAALRSMERCGRVRSIRQGRAHVVTLQSPVRPVEGRATKASRRRAS